MNLAFDDLTIVFKFGNIHVKNFIIHLLYIPIYLRSTDLKLNKIFR